MKKFILLLSCFLIITSCKEETTTPKEIIEISEEKKSDLELIPISFNQLSNWKKDNINEAYDAFMLSCSKINQIKREFIYNSKIKIPTKDYQDLCKKAQNTPDFRKFIEANFVPNLVKYQSSEVGKFTSYYEALLHASYTKSEKYSHPIYGRPNDLIEFNLADFDSSLPSKRFVGRIVNNKLVPYYNRNDIYNNGIDAPVILWADNYIDIYVMQIQGSAVAKLDDGTEVRIAYADNNGRDFKGIGRILLDKKLLEPGQASMGNIKKWLKENIDTSHKHMNDNERYIFHRLSNASGPIGAQGVPLTSGRSLAVDNSFIPLGSLLWLETTGPQKENIKKLVVAQDIGSAIKGAVRGDYFWGSGGDEILELAGRMNSQGKYYILLPKNSEVSYE